jgi:ATP-dependent DNA helicase RecQ
MQLSDAATDLQHNCYSDQSIIVTYAGSGDFCWPNIPIHSFWLTLFISVAALFFQNQVMSLKQKGVRSDFLGSTQANKCVMQDAENGMFHVLYMTPEKALSLPSR